MTTLVFPDLGIIRLGSVGQNVKHEGKQMLKNTRF